MNQIKLFIQQKNIVINNLSLNFNDIKEGDIVEGYIMEEVEVK